MMSVPSPFDEQSQVNWCPRLVKQWRLSESSEAGWILHRAAKRDGRGCHPTRAPQRAAAKTGKTERKPALISNNLDN